MALINWNDNSETCSKCDRKITELATMNLVQWHYREMQTLAILKLAQLQYKHLQRCLKMKLLNSQHWNTLNGNHCTLAINSFWTSWSKTVDRKCTLMAKTVKQVKHWTISIVMSSRRTVAIVKNRSLYSRSWSQTDSTEKPAHGWTDQIACTSIQ